MDRTEITGQERRRAPRVKTRFPVRVAHEGGVLTAVSRDLSATGIYCELDEFVPLNDTLEIDFALPGSTIEGKGCGAAKIRCRGVVVRNERVPGMEETRGLALFFTDLRSGSRRMVEEYVVDHLSHGKLPFPVRTAKDGTASLEKRVFQTEMEGEKGVSVRSAGFKVLEEGIDLNTCGLYCSTDRYVSPFSEIAVNLVFPQRPGVKKEKKEDIVQCNAVVVDCTKHSKEKRFSMAAYFTGLSSAEKKRIAKEMYALV